MQIIERCPQQQHFSWCSAPWVHFELIRSSQWLSSSRTSYASRRSPPPPHPPFHWGPWQCMKSDHRRRLGSAHPASRVSSGVEFGVWSLWYAPEEDVGSTWFLGYLPSPKSVPSIGWPRVEWSIMRYTFVPATAWRWQLTGAGDRSWSEGQDGDRVVLMNSKKWQWWSYKQHHFKCYELLK